MGIFDFWKGIKYNIGIFDQKEIKYRKAILRICDKHKIPLDSALRNYFKEFEYHDDNNDRNKEIEDAKKFLEGICVGEKLEKAISCLEDIREIRI